MANQKVDGIEVELTVSSGKFTKELNEADKKVEQTADKMKKELKEANEEIISSFDGLGSAIEGALTGALAGIMTLAGAIGGLALNGIFEMESAMSQLQASTGATNEEMAEFEEVAKNIYANNWGDSWDDVANSMSTVNKTLGVTGEELQFTTEKALTIRDTFGVDVPESLRATDTLMKQFGLTSGEAMNLITQGYQQNLDFSGEFLDSINEYSPHFKMLGMDAEDMFNVFGSGAESGAFNLDKIGDAVKELGIRTQDMSDTTRDAYKSLGLDVKATEKAFAEGGEAGAKAFDDVIKGIEGIEDPLKRNEVGVALFGTMWEDLGEDVVLSLNDIKDGFDVAVDSATELTDIKYDNIGSAFEGIKRQIEVGALIPIGEQLLPLLNEFANYMQNEGIPKIVEFANVFGQQLASGVSACMPLIKVLGDVLLFLMQNINTIVPLLLGMVTAFKSFTILTWASGLFTTLSTAITLAGGLMPWIAGLIGMINLPILAVAGAIGLLVVAFATNFGGIRDITFEIFNTLQDFFTTWWDGVNANFGESLQAISQLVKVVWDSIKTYINAVMTAISGIIKAITQIMKGDWKGAWETIKNTASTVLNAMKSIISNLFNAIVNVVIAIGVNLANAMYNAWNSAKQKATEVWNSLVSWFKGAVNDPVGTINGILGSLRSAGASMINSVWEGCKGIWNGLSDWFSSKVNWIKDKLAFWRSSKSEMSGSSGGGGGGSSAFSSRSLGSRMAYSMPTSSNTNTTNITFSGNYSFSNRSDIDYFMKQAGQQMRRTR